MDNTNYYEVSDNIYITKWAPRASTTFLEASRFEIYMSKAKRRQTSTRKMEVDALFKD